MSSKQWFLARVVHENDRCILITYSSNITRFLSVLYVCLLDFSSKNWIYFIVAAEHSAHYITKNHTKQFSPHKTGYSPTERHSEYFLYLWGKCFIIHLCITGTEIVASDPEVIVTVTVVVTGATEVTVVIVTGIICKVYVVSRSKSGSIPTVAIGCMGRTGHIVLEIAISIVISQWIYESIWWINVIISGPWKIKWKNPLKIVFKSRHTDHAGVLEQLNGSQVCVPN